MLTPSGPDCPRTRQAFLAGSILNPPLLAVYSFFGVILYRDLHASAFQVLVLTMLRPLVSLLSLYWSHRIAQRPDRLLSNVLWSGLLARVPFLFFPWVTNPWTFIACASFYLMLSRGGIPAWMEILKQNLSRARRSQLFSDGTALGYLEGMVLAMGMGWALDHQAEAWRWICPASAAVGIFGLLFQLDIPVKRGPVASQTASPGPLWTPLVAPWRQAWSLLARQTDFRHFQWGFMLAGSGMMVLQPALPIFFVDVLGISYTELALALTVCKGIGFAASSRAWAHWFRTANLFNFSTAIFCAVAGFPLLLLLAPMHLYWLFAGYLLYGIAQAGSELCWHLSGPLFAPHEDSSVHSGVNVMMVGLRGAMAPPLGSFLCLTVGPAGVFGISCLLCAGGAALMSRWSPTYQNAPKAASEGS